METDERVATEANKEKLPTSVLFIPVESQEQERRKYFEKLEEKIEGSEEKEMLLFCAIVVELVNNWIEKFNLNRSDSLSSLDDLEKFLDWYCQPLDARKKAETITSYPFSDSVCITAILMLGKIGFVVREAAKEENSHKAVKKIESIPKFLKYDSDELFFLVQKNQTAAAH